MSSVFMPDVNPEVVRAIAAVSAVANVAGVYALGTLLLTRRMAALTALAVLCAPVPHPGEGGLHLEFWVTDYRWALTAGVLGALISRRRRLSDVPSLIFVILGAVVFLSVIQHYLLFAVDGLYLAGAWGFSVLTAAAMEKGSRKPLKPGLLSPLALGLIALGGAVISFR